MLISILVGTYVGAPEALFAVFGLPNGVIGNAPGVVKAAAKRAGPVIRPYATPLINTLLIVAVLRPTLFTTEALM